MQFTWVGYSQDGLSSAVRHASTLTWPEEWTSLVDIIANDSRGNIPADSEEEAELFESQVLDNASFRKKGPYVKMCSWFSILAAVEYHDSSWTSYRHLMTWMGDNTAAMTKGAEERRAAAERQISASIIGIDAASRALPAEERAGPAAGTPAAEPDTEPVKKQRKQTPVEKYREMMSKLRAAAGSALALAPRLMNDNNLVNMRIILLAGRVLWSEQSSLAMGKTTAEHQ